MSNRHQLAVECDGVQDLKKLAVFLTAAVNECEAEGTIPAVDPAVMVLSYQIAFSGNGDSGIPGYYRRLYRFCEDNAMTQLPKGMDLEQPGKPN